MLEKLLHRFLLRRHFWRYATFSEIAELYASKTMRMLAISMAGSFMSIYLFQTGYSVVFIASFWAAYFGLKALISLPVASLIAWIGAKHSILISNILYIPVMVAFALLPVYGPWLLIVVAVLQAISTSLFMIAYNIDFSKVKSATHAGKEIAYMNIVEKVTYGVSPLIGGLLAFLVAPEFVLIVSGVLFALAALPLLATAEPEAPRQKLQFAGFPWHLVRGMGVSQSAYGFDVFTSGNAWSLYVAIFIIGITSSNEVYLVNGLLLSVVVVAAIAASYTYGLLIDRKKGKQLMRVAIIANALTHVSRPFISTPVSVAGLNIANEAATTGYTMSYRRAVYDNADLSGRRTLYLGILEVLGSTGAALSAGVLAILASSFGNEIGLKVFFVVTGLVVLLILTARFPLYRR